MIHDAIFILWDYHINPELTNSYQNYKESIANLPPMEREVFQRVIKVAKSHSTIKRFVNKHTFASIKTRHHKHSNYLFTNSSGLYIQSLSEGLDEVLEPYRSSLVELERSALANPYLPVSYVFGSIEKFKPLFNTINSILTSIKEKKLFGCQILGVLNQHALSGNEETTTAIRKLLFTVHKVFFEQLCSWMLYGKLNDYQKEFFIHSLDKTTSSLPTSASISRISSTRSSDLNKSTLSDFGGKLAEYEIDPTMLPSYIPLSLAQKILFIGKSVVLFDSSPIDMNTTAISLLSMDKDINKRFTVWGDKEPLFHQSIQELKNSDIFNPVKLDILLDDVKLCVTEHLWVVAVEEAGVLHELQLMKDYFLLGRGELFLELLRLAEPLLNSKPTPVATRDINQAFHMAARAVLLGNSKDIEKFSFSIPYVKQDSSNDCEYGILDGWSTVVLIYKVKWPLHLLFTPEILHRYNEMFRFLLRVKKTQHDLHLLWCTYKKARRDRTSVWQLHNKLMFLVDNMQHYLQADVLESNYLKFKQEAEKINDFEVLKKMQNTFLTDILSQAFLLMNPISEDSIGKDEYTDYRTNPVMSNLLDVLHLCDTFCTMANETSDPDEEDYHVIGFTSRFEILVGKLLQLLSALRTQPCGTHLARLLMRLDFNRWFSSTAHLTQSVTYML